MSVLGPLRPFQPGTCELRRLHGAVVVVAPLRPRTRIEQRLAKTSMLKRQQVMACTHPRTAIHHRNIALDQTLLFEPCPHLVRRAEPAVVGEVVTEGKIDRSGDMTASRVDRFVVAEIAVRTSRIDQYPIGIHSGFGRFVGVR